MVLLISLAFAISANNLGLIGSGVAGQTVEDLARSSYSRFDRLLGRSALAGGGGFLRAEPQARECSLSGASIGNFGLVSENIYRGEKLDEEEDYRFLGEDLGVSTVINLRYFHKDDKRLCEKYKLRCAHYGIKLFPGGDAFFDWETLKKAFRFALEERRAGRKIYIHCKHGSDRAGALASAIMIRERACGRSFDKDTLWKIIRKTLDKYGFHHTYFSLYKGIKSWVYNFEENKWLCN